MSTVSVMCSTNNAPVVVSPEDSVLYVPKDKAMASTFGTLACFCSCGGIHEFPVTNETYLRVLILNGWKAAEADITAPLIRSGHKPGLIGAADRAALEVLDPDTTETMANKMAAGALTPY